MFDSILAWVSRTYGHYSAGQCSALAAAMLDVYYSDPAMYAGTSMQRLHDAAIAVSIL